MSEVTSALSCSDLILRVAEAAGLAYYGSDGQGIACIPVDKYNFDKCKRIVNDGIRMFISRAPENGWKWRKRMASITFPTWVTGTADSGTETTLVDAVRTEVDDYFNGWILYIVSGTGIGQTATITNFTSLTGTFAFTALSGASTPDTTSVYRVFDSITNIINYDPARYLMPEDFGGEVTGPIRYAKNTGHGPIQWSTQATIQAIRQCSTSRGYPNLAAYVPYQPTSQVLGSARRWELLLEASPVAADTVEFPYTACFDKMQMESGITTGGAATTLADSTRKEADNYFNGWILTIIAGTGEGETATVADYTKSTGTFTFSALSGASTPNTTSAYMVQPSANLHPAGFQFDEAVKGACFAELEMQIKDTIDGAIEYFNKVALPDAWRTDKGSAPRTVGNLNDRNRAGQDLHNWNVVTNDNDI
jgi:hypothetical protein